MADFKLATAGDDIKVWDCNGYTLIKQYNPHSNNVSSIAWSQDNNFIASTSAAGDKVSVTCIKNSAYTITELAAGEDRTCVTFNSNSRYLLSGGKNGALAVWDLKTQKMKKQYKDHTSPITALTFNWNDTYIASGATNGDIILYNVVTAHGSQPMNTNNTQSIRQLEYSHFRKSLLGAASDDGVVNLWDTNTRRLSHSFSQMHCASVTGLSFSPLNEMLMMSVGLDKRIVCYDVLGKAGVRTMTAEYPLSCIDIHPDGATLAIGTVKGKVLIYDLRCGAQPIQSLTAHKSAVQAVQFMNNVRTTKDDSATRSKSSRINQIRKLHSANSSPKTLMNGDSGDGNVAKGLTDRTNLEYSLANRSGDKTGCESEVISPYKDVSLVTKNWEADKTSENKPEPAGESSVGDMGVFSPLAANGSTSSLHDSRSSVGHNLSDRGHSVQSPYLSSRALSRTGPTPRQNGPTSPPTDKVPLSDPGNSSSSDSQSSTENTHVTRLSTNKISERLKNSSPRGTSTPIQELMNGINNNMVSKADLLSTSPRTVLQTKQVQRTLSTEGGVTDWRAISGNEERRKPDTPRSDRGYESSMDRRDSNGHTIPSNGQTTLQNAVATTANGSSSTVHSSNVNAHSTVPYPVTSVLPAVGTSTNGIASASGGPRAFQMDLIQSMINESMEEFQDEIRRDMMKLHVEMLRQFQIQQMELMKLVKQHSVNDDLLAEIERLREENRRLKKTF